MQGVSIALFPTSWRLGPWNKGHKWLFAIGPFRLVWHRGVTGQYGAASPAPGERTDGHASTEDDDDDDRGECQANRSDWVTPCPRCRRNIGEGCPNAPA